MPSALSFSTVLPSLDCAQQVRSVSQHNNVTVGIIATCTQHLHARAPLTQEVLCRDKVSSALYFKYNTQLGPPYTVLVDTNFINFSIRNKVR